MTIKQLKEFVNEFKPKKTKHPFVDKRIKGYGIHGHPYYSFFYFLAKKLKPKVTVELGSWQGTSAACFAAGNPAGLVITVDHHTDPGDEENKLLTIEATKNLGNLFYHQGWTCPDIYNEEVDEHALERGQSALPKVVEQLRGRKIDLLFIDSWHRYDQALRDWEAYKPLLNKGALVICDDIYGGKVGEGIEDMDKFWADMTGDKFLSVNLHPGYPMGFLKV